MRPEITILGRDRREREETPYMALKGGEETRGWGWRRGEAAVAILHKNKRSEKMLCVT